MEDINQKKVFSKNLRRYVSATGKTQAEIAKSIGVSPQTFNTWMHGVAIPRMNKMQILADFLGINKADLIEDEIDAIINRRSDLQPIRKIRSVPILGTITCRTSIWSKKNFERYIGIDPTFMDGEFALIGKGNSMIDAEIYDGDIVLMKKVSELEDGKIAAVLIENEATLKKVYKKENLLILQSCNDNDNPVVYSNKEMEDSGIQIIGECVGVYHPKKR